MQHLLWIQRDPSTIQELTLQQVQVKSVDDTCSRPCYNGTHVCTSMYFGLLNARINAMTAVAVDAPGVAVHLDTGPDSGWRHWKDRQHHP